ncbi:MAG: threonine/serine exporter family protein [Lachnospiraceae bacterium]|nr:threonine/serine exporter family protein [Lachnospiraceae bacterium]
MRENLDYLLDFSLRMGEELIVCGANIERVSDTVYRVCDSYHCRDVQFFALDCYLTLSLEDGDGVRVSGQRCIRRGQDIHMERLGRLNQLSRRVCETAPEPERLEGMLAEALNAKGYPLWITLLFSLLSAVCLTGIYNGSMRDLSIVVLNTFLAFLSGIYLRRLIYNKIIYNIVSAFIIGTVAIFFDKIGYLDGYSTVMIVNSLKLVPGIPMVNSFRNLLSGNEINGILELLKLIFQTIAIGGGFLLSILLLYGRLM